MVIEEIVDHRSDNTAIPISEGTTRSANGQERPKITMRGWELLTSVKVGELIWASLKELKNSNPIELAEYAVAN